MDKRSSAESHREAPAQAGIVGPALIQVDLLVSPAFSGALNEDLLRIVAEAALSHEDASGQVTLVITGDQEIQALNRDFLGVDAPTDVLAFGAEQRADGNRPMDREPSQSENASAGAFVVAPEAESYLGDVILSYPRAVVQAEEAGHTTEKELALLVVHGILHLLGYDHADDLEMAIMWRRQEAILQSA